VGRGDFYFQRPPKPGEEKTFAQLFPTAREIEIEIEESGARLRRPRTHYFSKQFVAHVVDGGNPRYVKGGVFLGPLVSELIRKGSTSFHEMNKCRGFEGSPKGRRFHGPCDHTFTITIRIAYMS
jgi:hypothetical protein